jgi:hypothetical protein
MGARINFQECLLELAGKPGKQRRRKYPFSALCP